MQEKIKLTGRERVIFEFIVLFRKEKHFSPSMRQIAKGVGLSSASTVFGHIHSIEQKGWLLPYDGTPGSIIPATEYMG